MLSSLEINNQILEDALNNQKGNIDYAKAQAELAEAVAQVQAIQRLRKKK